MEYNNTPSVIVALIPIIGTMELVGVKRLDNGLVALPGGWQEYPLTIHENAVKEVMEETNISTKPEEYTVFDAVTVPNRKMNLIFVLHSGIYQSNFLKAIPDNQEVSSIEVITPGDKLAFDLHTDAVIKWWKQTFK